MSDYKPEDLLQDTKSFLKSQLGQHIVTTLHEMASGYLVAADNMECSYPERYLAKHSAIKEVLNFIHSPLDDDTPSHG